jgi:hypothetical protein
MTKYYWWLLVSVFPVVALAQGLPGVVREGEYIQGTLGSIYQAAPAPAQGDSVYSVGAWPTYTPPLADGAGKDLVVGFCQVCHSTAYITEQPPLPAGAWDATVKKMINDFGAAIPEESAGQIITYLQAHYAPGNRQQ